MTRVFLILLILISRVTGQVDLQKLAAQQKFFDLIKSIEQTDYANNPALRFSLAESYLNCAVLSNILQRISQQYALDYYKKYLEENPKDKRGWFYFGQYLALNNQNKEAKKAFEKSKKNATVGKLVSVWQKAFNEKIKIETSSQTILEEKIVNKLIGGRQVKKSKINLNTKQDRRHANNFICYLIASDQFIHAKKYVFEDSLKLIDYKIPTRKKDNTVSYAFYYNPYILGFLQDFFIHFAKLEFGSIKSGKYKKLIDARMNMLAVLQDKPVFSKDKLFSVFQKYFDYLNEGKFPDLDDEVTFLNKYDYQGRFIYNQVINSMYADPIFKEDNEKGLELFTNLNKRDLTNAPFYLALYSKNLYASGLTGNMFLALDYSYELMEKIPFARPFRAYQQALVLYNTKRGEKLK